MQKTDHMSDLMVDIGHTECDRICLFPPQRAHLTVFLILIFNDHIDVMFQRSAMIDVFTAN